MSLSPNNTTTTPNSTTSHNFNKNHSSIATGNNTITGPTPHFTHLPTPGGTQFLAPNDPSIELTRLSKDLKYRELFKKSPKSTFKGFSHFFLSQELDSSESIDSSDSISEDNSSTFTDDIDKSSLRKTSLSKSHFIPHNSMDRHANFNLKFSHDGKYLASAGDDGIIRIWQVITSGTERALYDIEKNKTNGNSSPTMCSSTLNTFDDGESSYEFGGLGTTMGTGTGTLDSNLSNNSKFHKTTADKKKKKHHALLFAPVFKSKPIKQFHHSDTVIDLDWSINNFLLSSSEDHTVKLWNVERDDCLKTFKFNSFVTTVKFYRKDDRFFSSGEYDGSLKFWSILDDSIVYQTKCKSSITCLEFSPTSKDLFVGCADGHFFAFSTIELSQNATFQLKTKNKAIRLTGIESFTHKNDTKLLISSNDSKVRLFSYTNKILEVKFSGLDNEYSTISAVTNENHNYIISGSEDGWSYLWNLNFDDLEKLSNEKHKKLINWDIKSIFKEDTCLSKNKNYGAFHAHSSRCNAALFAPRATLKLLELSNDPIFDLKGKYGSYIETPNSKGLTDDELDDLSTAIIVSTDNHGLIRIFRRDLSYTVRKQLQSKKATIKSDMKIRSFSIGRNRSRSFSNNTANNNNNSSFNKADYYSPDKLTFKESDEKRGRDDFNKESSLATKFSVENSKSRVPLPTISLPNTGSIVKNSYTDLKSIDATLKDMLKRERSEFIEYDNIDKIKEGDYQLTQQQYQDQDQEDDNFTLNSNDSAKKLKSSKKCHHCGGDKFTAKPIDGSTLNYIEFVCDNCGRLIQY